MFSDKYGEEYGNKCETAEAGSTERLPASADENRQEVNDEHAFEQPHNSKPEAVDDIDGNSLISEVISSPGATAEASAALPEASAAAAEAAAPVDPCPVRTVTGAERTVKELISAAAPAAPEDLPAALEECPRAFFKSIQDAASTPTQIAGVGDLLFSRKNKIIRTVKHEPNRFSLNVCDLTSDQSLQSSDSDEVPGMQSLKEGRDRICHTPFQARIEESPVMGSGSSFGLAADDSQDPSAEQRRRMQVLNRESGRMRDLLDSVQEKVQKVWDDGYRVKISIESFGIQRRHRNQEAKGLQRSGADLVSEDGIGSHEAPEGEVPISLDAVGTEKPLAMGDGMEGDGEWVRIKNGIGMDTCCAAHVMPTTWLPQFESEPGKSRQRYIGATGKVVENKGQKLLKWFTNEGQGRSMMFQMTDVNKILACIAEVCDGGNDVLFRKNGGMIIPQGDMKLELKTDGNITNFNRTGNTYAMDAWVKRTKPKAKAKAKGHAMDVDAMSGFTRPGVAA